MKKPMLMIFLAVFSANAMASMTVMFQDSYGNNGGGEFIAIPSGFDFTPASLGESDGFETFGVEKNEWIFFNMGFSVEITDAAVNGGVGGQESPGSDPLNEKTAYLYEKFITGSLIGYDYTPGSGRVASANALQRAIWYIENEITTLPSGLATTFYNDALLNGTGQGIGDVRIMNVYAIKGDCRIELEDQLVMIVPIFPLSLLNPNGGETLISGSVYAINWSSTGSTDNVLIEYSIDNGLNWNNITTVPNIGSYDWLVPTENSNQCLVRVSDANDPNINDISDAVFTIIADVNVPDVVGMTQGDAETTLFAAGLVVGNITQDYSDTIPAGSVISQNPIAGTQVSPGSSVDLVISFGRLIVPEMVTVPSGSFQMGDSFSEGYPDELPLHRVTLDSFYMGKYEITNGQYCAFLNFAYPSQLKVNSGIVYASDDSSNSYPYCYTSSKNPYSQIAYSGGIFSVRTKGGRNMSNDPMVEISWYGAAAYCNWRSQQEGKEQCYNLSTWDCNFSKKGYRLPTEAEWEYAARGGLSDKRFPWGDTITHSQANYYSSSSYSYDISPTRGYHPTWNDGIYPYTSPVGSFSANGFGLYDMAGNVWEWCNDWNGAYSADQQTNPTGPTSGCCRVMRGGDWHEDAHASRVARRGYDYPSRMENIGLGFRVVLPKEIRPDLKITSEDIGFGRVPGMPCEPNTISATVHNEGLVAANDVEVVFKDFDEIIGSPVVIPIILSGDSNTISIEHTWPQAGFHLITVTVDPYNDINESDETNNNGSKLYQVGDIGAMNAIIEVTYSPPSGTEFPEGTTVNISGEAHYRIGTPNEPDYVYPVKGGSVTAEVFDSNGVQQNLIEGFTDIDGRFNISFTVPVKAGKVFDVNIAVTDVTLTGTCKQSYKVGPPRPKKDLWVSDIIFSGNAPNITIGATVYAKPDNTVTDYNVPVSFYRYPPQDSNQIGETQVIPALPPSANEPASVTWHNAPNGIYCIKAELGPGFSDDDSGNNYATQPLVVGPAPTSIVVVIETPQEDANVNASDTIPVTVNVTDNNGNIMIPCVLQMLTLDFNGADIRHVDLKSYFDWDSSRYVYPWQPPTDANGLACIKATARIADVLGDANGSNSICVDVNDNACPSFNISASPYWAKRGQSVWITVESSEQLLNDQLNWITVKDNADQNIAFSPAEPCHPSATRWNYQTVSLPENTALGRATIKVQGTDLHGNTCPDRPGKGYFYVVEDEVPDFWVYSNDITFSNDNPAIGEQIVISTVIHTDSTITVSDIPVTFYAQNLGGSYKIGDTQYIGQIVPPNEVSSPVDVNWTNAACGWYIIEAEIGPNFPNDRNYMNNKATHSLVVGTKCDFDCDGKVDFEDLAKLAELWLWVGPVDTIPEDLIRDGTVNFPDFAICAKNWMEGL